jgi:hypothetical protein
MRVCLLAQRAAPSIVVDGWSVNTIGSNRVVRTACVDDATILVEISVGCGVSAPADRQGCRRISNLQALCEKFWYATLQTARTIMRGIGSAALVSCLVAVAMGAAVCACSASLRVQGGRSVFVAKPPPEPLPEMRSGPPAAGMAWVAGYWHFNGTDYVWIPGHWESPRPGLAWRPPTVLYSADQRAWIYEHGRWEAGDGRAAR